MIAIIPARSGSKGLPGKNIKLLANKPLIAYTIEAALKSKAVSRVIVSTDDSEIATIADKYGAEIPFLRPEHLATDNAKAIDTYLYTIERLEKEENIKIDEIMVLQVTSPLRNHIDVDSAYDLYKDKNADSVVSYTKEHHPISWHKYIENDGKLTDIRSGENLENRQELRESYYPNGAIYIYSKRLLYQRKYYSSNSYAYVMNRVNSVDIDTVEDFELAEYYLGKYK